MSRRKAARHRLTGHGQWHHPTPRRRTRRVALLVVAVLLILAAIVTTVVVACAEDSVRLKVDTVTVVGVSDRTWTCLRDRGYAGTPGDGLEALSVPFDQLHECARGDTLSA
ncbi:hypothetical protein TOK_0478 [Pseudonocardia sp. N23]|nr:hypothetical protein TOK_0478 [Pseudonocardia sp. N23]